jgi:hypothetical protein
MIPGIENALTHWQDMPFVESTTATSSAGGWAPIEIATLHIDFDHRTEICWLTDLSSHCLKAAIELSLVIIEPPLHRAKSIPAHPFRLGRKFPLLSILMQ